MQPKFLSILVLALAVCGCSGPQTTFTSQGASAYRLSCGGFFGDGDLGGCYKQAGDICQEQGFRVIQSGVSSMIIECRSQKAEGTELPMGAR